MGKGMQPLQLQVTTTENSDARPKMICDKRVVGMSIGADGVGLDQGIIMCVL